MPSVCWAQGGEAGWRSSGWVAAGARHTSGERTLTAAPALLPSPPQAHPPIHPLKPYGGGDREKEALFEFIVRHFLA